MAMKIDNFDFIIAFINPTNIITVQINILITITSVIDTIVHQFEILIAICVIAANTSSFIMTHGTFTLIFKFNTPDLFLLYLAMNNMDNFNPIICKLNTILTIIVEIAGIYTFLIMTATTNVTWMKVE